MKIYNYDKDTKEFISEGLAQLDELSSELNKKDTYLIPANATQVKPLEQKSGFAICFNESLEVWEYKEDFRGKSFYHKQTKQEHKVNSLDFNPQDYTELKPDEFSTTWDNENNKWLVDSKKMAKHEKEQLISNFKRIVQERLDTKAREKGYDDIVSACSYAGYANDFHDEAVQFGLWRSRVWKWGYSLLKQYKDTNASELSIDELLKGMPEFEDVANNH